MKTIMLLSFLLVFTYVNSQEIQFPPSIVSAGGSSIVNNKAHLSKWRIGAINVYFIESEDLKNANVVSIQDKEEINALKINAYPNPVTDYLNVDFKIKEPSTFEITVFDVSGKKVIINEKKFILSNQIIQLDFRNITPSLYLINIRNSELTINRNFKISKS